jgi:ankyrin repeat protein
VLLAVLLTCCTPSLHDLAAHGDNAAIESMVKADPALLGARNDLGKTALHYAATQNQAQTAEILINLGADVNAQDTTGLTPLHLAAIFGYTDVAGVLYSHGASLTVADDFGDTPLHCAAIHGQLPMIERLLDWGSDPAATNKVGLTPATLARKHSHDDAAKLVEEIAAELQ